MYQSVIATESLPWMGLDFPGVFVRIIHKNAQTGSLTVMTRLDAGAKIPAHFHQQANETVFVLSGDFIESGKTFGAGNYFTADAGTPHGPHESSAGCLLLTTFSAELDFQII